jgi:hypothetical protein
MDGQKFDKLTRAFAAGTDRRTLLKIFGGASVAAVAGVKIATPTGVFAQGSVGPGGTCATDADCAQGLCDPTALVCYCEDPARPVIGCACTTGTQDPCYGTSAVCCANEVAAGAGADGTCVSDSVGCNPTGECDALQTMCEGTGCCAEDTECGANGWCYGCYSGTQNPCGPYNEAFGADYICCTYGDTAIGAVGYCVAESECVVAPPNTGSGPIQTSNSWLAPAAAIGAAAAVLAYKSREDKAENEA